MGEMYPEEMRSNTHIFLVHSPLTQKDNQPAK
jgi:hypothetical protein